MRASVRDLQRSHRALCARTAAVSQALASHPNRHKNYTPTFDEINRFIHPDSSNTRHGTFAFCFFSSFQKPLSWGSFVSLVPKQKNELAVLRQTWNHSNGNDGPIYMRLCTCRARRRRGRQRGQRSSAQCSAAQGCPLANPVCIRVDKWIDMQRLYHRSSDGDTCHGHVSTCTRIDKGWDGDAQASPVYSKLDASPRGRPAQEPK